MYIYLKQKGKTMLTTTVNILVKETATKVGADRIGMEDNIPIVS